MFRVILLKMDSKKKEVKEDFFPYVPVYHGMKSGRMSSRKGSIQTLPRPKTESGRISGIGKGHMTEVERRQ